MYDYKLEKARLWWTPHLAEILTSVGFFCETTSPKAKRIGIGKLNNPAAKRRGIVKYN